MLSKRVVLVSLLIMLAFRKSGPRCSECRLKHCSADQDSYGEVAVRVPSFVGLDDNMGGRALNLIQTHDVCAHVLKRFTVFCLCPYEKVCSTSNRPSFVNSEFRLDPVHDVFAFAFRIQTDF